VRAYQEAHGRAANDFEAGIETYEEDEEEEDVEVFVASSQLLLFVEHLHRHISTPDGFTAAVRDLRRFSETSIGDISERDYSSAAVIVCAVANAAISFGAARGQRRFTGHLFDYFVCFSTSHIKSYNMPTRGTLSTCEKIIQRKACRHGTACRGGLGFMWLLGRCHGDFSHMFPRIY
jgi:hypothetical protein